MAHIHPSLEEFREQAKRGNLVPVYREMLADMDTPVSALKKLDDADCLFLLESVEQGENIGRYSFLGANPRALFKCKGELVEIDYLGEQETVELQGPPLDALRDFMARYKPVENPDLPPFTGGAVGYIGYDTIRTIERIPDSNPDDLNLPDCFFMIAKTLVVFDHVKRRMILIANAFVGDKNVEEAYRNASHELDVLAEHLARPMPMIDDDESEEPADPADPPDIRSNMAKEEYEAIVEKCREYIFAGDAFQIVPSQRFQRPLRASSLDVYRALRAVNPSPYNFYLKFGELRLVGSSPEILCRVTGDEVRIRPIAGTRKRGETREGDLALAEELLADPKERAEHIMLVDLGRNDLGRVCEYGSVRIDDLMVVERYSHVMHIVSGISGKLRKDLDGFDAVKATFPHGTVSGAPKIRAMEIIDECESVKRGPYSGCVGYFSFNGNVDTCIAIRTIIVKDGVAYVQAGAGIVADSVPENEHYECVNKAKGMFRAVDWADRDLDL